MHATHKYGFAISLQFFVICKKTANMSLQFFANYKELQRNCKAVFAVSLQFSCSFL